MYVAFANHFCPCSLIHRSLKQCHIVFGTYKKLPKKLPYISILKP